MMNFVKRAMFSMKMRFLKNIGYTLIFSALSVMIFAGLLIYQAAGEKTEAYKENLAAAVTLQEKPTVTEGGTYTNPVPDGIADRFLSDSRVKKYNKINTAFGQPLNFTPLYTVDDATYQAQREEALAGGINIELIFYGVTDSASFDAFTANGCTLVEGI